MQSRELVSHFPQKVEMVSHRIQQFHLKVSSAPSLETLLGYSLHL